LGVAGKRCSTMGPRVDKEEARRSTAITHVSPPPVVPPVRAPIARPAVLAARGTAPESDKVGRTEAKSCAHWYCYSAPAAGAVANSDLEQAPPALEQRVGAAAFFCACVIVPPRGGTERRQGDRQEVRFCVCAPRAHGRRVWDWMSRIRRQFFLLSHSSLRRVASPSSPCRSPLAHAHTAPCPATHTHKQSD
jgi:hypothetical protein